MSEPQEPREGQAQLNIELSEDVAEGIFTNLVMIAHSSEEFILDFIRVLPGVAKARVKSRVIITPQHAKRLRDALNDNIRRYESMHGEIVEPGNPAHAMHFRGPGGEA